MRGRSHLLIRIAPPVLVVVILASVLLYLAPWVAKPEPSGESPGGSIWELPLPVVTGEGVSSESMKLSVIGGGPAVVEFMVSWCDHCKNMAPVIEELYQEYGDSVRFLSIAGSWSGANEKTTAEFIRTYGTSWPHLFDARNALFEYFNVEATPTYLLFNSQGELVKRMRGEVPLEVLAGELERLAR